MKSIPKKVSKGLRQFFKKISKIFKCLCFKRTILELISQDYHDGIPEFPDKEDAAPRSVQDITISGHLSFSEIVKKTIKFNKKWISE